MCGNVCVFLGVLKQKKAAVTSDLDIHRIAVEQGHAPRDRRKMEIGLGSALS